MSTLTYRGYTAIVEFDSEDMILTGRIAGINDIIGFHAETPAELLAAFHEAVDDYLETCAKLGKQPEKTYSGKVMFRVPPELHARVALAAKLAGKSLNQWGEAVLERAAG
jgi:predicted HicB family RNase H-like nuclease